MESPLLISALVALSLVATHSAFPGIMVNVHSLFNVVDKVALCSRRKLKSHSDMQYICS